MNEDENGGHFLDYRIWNGPFDGIVKLHNPFYINLLFSNEEDELQVT